MKLSKKEIKKLVDKLGFIPLDGTQDVYYKSYKEHNEYTIKVNFDTEKIEYGDEIQVEDNTTSNFENSENFVVLECVNRLLVKGYSPNKLILECKWLIGKKEKGKLDILVKDINEKAFMMIECKTWGLEYEKEKRKMQRDGGQLFSYFQQDKGTEILCLYSSRYYEDSIEYCNDIVKVDEQWRELDNQKEVFDHWNKNFKDNGVFDSWASSYNIEIKALTRGRLKALTEDDSSRIFNQFAEILRHNIVSDKPNAFNKIFNLFLCKIVDEDKTSDEELEFQWLENDTDESLQKRLNDLYKRGMKEYLAKEVTDFTDQQLEDTLISVKNIEERKRVKEIFTKLRLQKNNEFAFKEVFDDKSFYENAVVVREVVELLQPFQIRYGHKQQFLGDFFELLLNTGIKQEAGQFFTPVPIAKYIISSLPIRELIQKNIKEGKTDILPYTIDFAAGSGHFLTEIMDEIQKIIEDIEPSIQRPSIKSKIISWKSSPYDWALEYIYGVEADYRLVKTAKVSCFLNGDGLANVIHADGLDSFEKSKDYKGKLKEYSKDNKKDNGQFDILIANPPYSVSAFKNTLKNGNESFELYNRLTEDSSEIECLFIERTKQLLKPGGWAGIILPSSILSNSGIYTAARELILKYFSIKGITEFGSNTFMATGTNTIALFLERRKDNEWKIIEQGIRLFFENPKDATVNGIEKAFSLYVEEVYENINLLDYISFINKKPNIEMKQEEIFVDYSKWFENLTEVKKLKEIHLKELINVEKKMMDDQALNLSNIAIPVEVRELIEERKNQLMLKQKKELDKKFFEKIFDLEKEKLLYFFLAYNQETALVKVGERQQEKEYLGYEFSNRRGHEGIKMHRDQEGNLTTKLYDDKYPLNEKKANYYIHSMFSDKRERKVHDVLGDSVSINPLTIMINWKTIIFGKEISLTPKKKNKIITKYPQVKLSDVVTLISGQSPSSEFYNSKDEGLPFYQGKTEFGEIFLKEPTVWTRKVTKESIKGDIVMSVRAPVGPVNINDLGKICIGRGLSALRVEKNLDNKYLFYLLKYNQNIIVGNDGAIFKSITRQQILDIKIPLPPMDVQKKIAGELTLFEELIIKKSEQLKRLKTEIMLEANSLYDMYKTAKLKDFCFPPKYGANEKAVNGDPSKDYRYIRITDINDNGSLNDDWKTALNVEEKYVLEDGDFLFARSGATVGKTFLYKQHIGKALFAGYLIRFRTKTGELLPEMLEMITKSSQYEEWVDGIKRGSAQPNINGKMYSDFLIPVIPIDEQHKIVDNYLHKKAEIKTIFEFLKSSDNEKEEMFRKYLD